MLIYAAPMTLPPEVAGGDAPEPIEAIEAAPLNVHMQQLAYLRAVERHGSLTEAARRLGVTQPALSQAIAQLERRLGTPLLERAGRGRRLTEAGLEVARFASEVLGRAAELREWLQEYEAGGAGVLRVGMIDAGSLYVLPETVRAFRDASPGVQLRLIVDRSAVLLDRLAGRRRRATARPRCCASRATSTRRRTRRRRRSRASGRSTRRGVARAC